MNMEFQRVCWRFKAENAGLPVMNVMTEFGGRL